MDDTEDPMGDLIAELDERVRAHRAGDEKESSR